MNADASSKKDRVTIILHSGAYDRASYALSIALVALSSGMKVHLLLTYEGLRRFTKGRLSDIGEETPATLRPDIEMGLEIGIIQPLDQQLAEAKKLGLRIYACPNAIASLNIHPSHLQPEVDEVMGLAAFLELARTASVNWYI